MFRELHPIVLAAGVALVPVFLHAPQPHEKPSPVAGLPFRVDRAPRDRADLVTAIRNADAQVVRKLIEDGADVNARDAEGNTPLILASFYASPKCVALLLEEGADANVANEAGVTALVRAATNYEKTRLLVDWGAQGPGANGRSRQHAPDPGRPPRRQFANRQITARARWQRDGAEQRRYQSDHRGRGERRSGDGATSTGRRGERR